MRKLLNSFPRRSRREEALISFATKHLVISTREAVVTCLQLNAALRVSDSEVSQQS
jgi:hypothetical protein